MCSDRDSLFESWARSSHFSKPTSAENVGVKCNNGNAGNACGSIAPRTAAHPAVAHVNYRDSNSKKSQCNQCIQERFRADGRWRI